MTASSSTGQPARFLPLEQADFQRLEHAGYLKGLLQPFKGKGSLEAWANQCTALRDDLIGLAHRRVLPQARAYPFNAARRATGPADHWRRDDLPALAQPRPFLDGRGAVGIAARPPGDAGLADRRPVRDGAAAHRAEHADQPPSHARPSGPGVRQQGPQAEAAYLRRVHGHAASVPSTNPKESP
jgi:hypothetical protein